MKTKTHSLLISVGLGSFLAFVSAGSILSGAMDSLNPPLITKILLWNIVLAVQLISSGILPACGNCELAVLLYVMFYSFIIGLIGYSLAFYCVILLIKKIKIRNSKFIIFL
jgi:hypothetical protein